MVHLSPTAPALYHDQQDSQKGLVDRWGHRRVCESASWASPNREETAAEAQFISSPIVWPDRFKIDESSED